MILSWFFFYSWMKRYWWVRYILWWNVQNWQNFPLNYGIKSKCLFLQLLHLTNYLQTLYLQQMHGLISLKFVNFSLATLYSSAITFFGCSLVVTCWERADFLAPCMWCFLVHLSLPIWFLGQALYLIVSIPDLCLLHYFDLVFRC